MKKLLFSLVSFIMCFSVVSAHIEDAKFVGGTGGSKILELNVEKEKIVTNGVIYDKNASLVYEISYTNASDIDKRVTDVLIPDSDIILSYDFSDIDKDRIIKSGETVNFKYSIKALENVSIEELESLNEYANAQLVFSSVKVENPDTLDVIILVFVLLLLAFSIYIFTKDKKIFYGCFVLSLSVLLLNFGAKVFANDCEIVDIDTGVKYIFSNLAPSCANLNYEGDFCIDWKEYGNRDLVHYLVMEDYKDMKDSYSIGDVSFSLQNTYDVSEQQNGDVILGIYKALTEEESYLFLIGQDDGVIVPKDASYQFTSYDKDSNNSSNDFHFVKYLDFSNFYSNKTTNMEYMLTGIGTQVNMTRYDFSGFETSNVTNMKGMFIGFGEYTTNLILDLSMFDTSKVTDMSRMFFEFGAVSENIDLDLSNFDTSNVITMEKMFSSFGQYAKNIDLDIYDFDTSNVTTMKSMFSGYAQFADYVKIDFFKNWDTSNVTDMSDMFSGFVVLEVDKNKYTDIDLTGLDVENVTNMSSMFYYNVRLREVDFSMLNVSNIENIDYMFAYTPQMKKIVFGDNFNTSKLKSLNGVFFITGTYYYIEELDLSMLDFSNVTDGSHFIYNAGIEKIKFPDTGFKKLETSNEMFYSLPVLEILDLSKSDFSTSKDYSNMFGNKDNYKGRNPKIFDLSGSDWNEDAVVTDMFKNIEGSTIYVKDEKAKAFIEKQAPDCTVLIKE